MEGVRAVLIQRTERAGARMLGREEADNEAYVFRAALSKLRTEFNVRTRNTGLEARNGVSAVRRELEHLERKMAGDMQVLKHDVEMDMNSSKDENRNDKKTLDILIEVSDYELSIWWVGCCCTVLTLAGDQQPRNYLYRGPQDRDRVSKVGQHAAGHL
jgi:hypothetical protein